jgi:uncharacterized protein YjiS (DUF1127 family)
MTAMNAHSVAAANTHVRTPTASPARLNPLERAVRRVGLLLSALRNRRAAHRLAEFSDRDLADIGLTRDDVGYGLSQPLSVDPTVEFAHRARVNARRSHI